MQLAFVMINTVPDKMESVLDEIKEIEGVDEAYMLYGVYDIVAVIKTETPEVLKEIILHIRAVKQIISTLTLMGIN
jgi:DNA-binding Lrp family transcriptional regulator